MSVDLHADLLRAEAQPVKQHGVVLGRQYGRTAYIAVEDLGKRSLASNVGSHGMRRMIVICGHLHR